MKIILSAIITIVLLVGLFIRPLRKHRWKILAGYAVAVAALFAFYNYRTLDLILPFYRPVNQMFYQEEFMESGEYVDAIIPYLTKDKTIYFPQYLNFDIAEEIKESNELWSSGSSLGMDLKNILAENGANVILADTGYGYDSTNRDMAEFVSENFDDMGYINEKGQLVVVGRKDAMIKHKGYRMELGEVEYAAKGAGGVGDCCCILDRTVEAGDIFLFYTGDVSEKELKAVLKEKLPKYAMPEHIIRLEQMPYNANMKIDRHKLAEMIKSST